MMSTAPATSVSAPPPSSSPSTQQTTRYALDGEPLSLEELLASNDFDLEEIERISNLLPGASLHLGGGAAPVFTLTRVGDQPDYRTWSNAMRFALVERALKALADEPECPAPVVEVAKKLLGKVRLAGYDEAVADAQVLGVRVNDMRPAVLWVLAIVLVEQISASWREEEVELYDADESFDEVLHAMGTVNATSLLKIGGTK